jgi:hypothetical protein
MCTQHLIVGRITRSAQKKTLVKFQNDWLTCLGRALAYLAAVRSPPAWHPLQHISLWSPAAQEFKGTVTRDEYFFDGL